MNPYIIAASVVGLLALVAAIAYAARARYEGYLSGHWIGNPAFVKRAGLTDLQLFLAPPEDGCRQGYLIMTNEDGDFIWNGALEVDGASFPALGALRACGGQCRASEIAVTYDDEDEPPMPKNMSVTMSILDGSLTLFDDKKIFAYLNKDLGASAAAVEAYNQE